MNLPYEVQQGLMRVFQSVCITSPLTVSPQERQQLTHALRNMIYERCFARNLSATRATEMHLSVEDFGTRLSAANHGRDMWLPGWRVLQIRPGGVITVTQHERIRFAKAGDYAMTFAEDVGLCIGCGVTLRLRKESFGLQEATYCALGHESPSPEEESDVLRVYFNAPEEAAISIVELVTKYFNEWSVPFTLKIMLRPQDRDRSDATVLYLPKNYYRHFVQLLSELPVLRKEVPLFTKPLLGGIGLAESPVGAESFGLNRCRLIAEGIVNAWLNGHQEPTPRLLAVEQRFASEGLSLAQPYLNPGSNDSYSTRLEDQQPSQDVRRVVLDPVPLTANNVLAFMRERGLCAETDWQILEYPSRNRNFGVVRPDGTGFFVKQLRVLDLESLGLMQCEAAVYQLAQCDPDFLVLKGLTPRFVAFDDNANIIILEFVRGESLQKATAEFGQKLGVTLATLHRETRVTSPPEIFLRRPPAILDAHRNGRLMRWLGPGQRLLIAQVRERRELAQALDELAASWRYETLIHGDIKFENCIVGLSGLYLIDWELADWGEPAWDVGSVLHSYLSPALRAHDTAAVDTLRAAAQKFWEAYANESLIERSLQCAAARTLQTALEVMHGQPQPTPQALLLFEASVELITRSGAITQFLNSH
ncbi:MAG TPA: T3SS effector HopA1 family protein [Pyrinomonadaceae bacterium]|nr:T3SS effector HopA1 family protein [Pyrinomonadaceae bacterium]